MKKLVAIITIFFLGFSAYNMPNLWTRTDDDIYSKVIRFHVIANSDLPEDQNLKLKVRDEVLDYIYPKLKESKDINQSREILKDNSENVKKISQKVVYDNGYKYDVDVKLLVDNFPIKSYGNITLPQGEYEAYKIIIGEGKGQNWWCVMFPPLCFVDITKGEVDVEETDEIMKEILGESGTNKIELKFKGLEIIKKIMK
ncbi:stage II sporulation protein R [Clostridium sp. MSJ-11]|uniref:Stage II sporulation protein R n=1 Tax=Clostridium mobile TaxID=2841512 RepID=A0ABS6ELQ6_9CLOT|nr:stage II sporulation protein R [Clostridium mobile]MBU5486149.1 stage II sporulation protein R [Clostridium mobile]